MAETKEVIPSIFLDLPQLEFSPEERREARKEIQRIQKEPITAMSKAKIIGLVIQNGLFELYPQIEELSSTKEISITLRRLSLDEDGGINGFKNEKWKETFFANVDYPHVAALIIRGKISDMDEKDLLLWSSRLEVTPIRRLPFLYDLVMEYKHVSDERKDEIKKLLQESIGDYIDKLKIGMSKVSQKTPLD